MPPVKAITVGNEWWSRSPSQPPASVLRTTNAAKGIAI
jgi:hypothetical protein